MKIKTEILIELCAAIVVIAISMLCYAVGFYHGKKHRMPDGAWVGISSTQPQVFTTILRKDGMNTVSNTINQFPPIKDGVWYRVRVSVDSFMSVLEVAELEKGNAGFSLDSGNGYACLTAW